MEITLTSIADGQKSLETVIEDNMQSISRWVKERNLKMNVEKTQLLLLGRCKRRSAMADVEV